MMNNIWLAHHGILGMKWGKRNGPPYPLSEAKSKAIKDNATKSKSDPKGDVTIKKGHKFERVYTTGVKLKRNDYRKKRVYVSDSASAYLNDYFVDDPAKIRIKELVANKELIFAGEKTINRLLKEIGEKPMPAVFDKNGNYLVYKKDEYTDRDFLFKNAEIGEKFIKKALEKGYDGVRDPVDDMAIGFDPSAKILFNRKGYTVKRKERSY